MNAWEVIKAGSRDGPFGRLLRVSLALMAISTKLAEAKSTSERGRSGVPYVSSFACGSPR